MQFRPVPCGLPVCACILLTDACVRRRCAMANGLCLPPPEHGLGQRKRSQRMNFGHVLRVREIHTYACA